MSFYQQVDSSTFLLDLNSHVAYPEGQGHTSRVFNMRTAVSPVSVAAHATECNVLAHVYVGALYILESLYRLLC